MESETLPDTTPERSGATGGSGTAGRDAPNFCEGGTAEQTQKSRVENGAAKTDTCRYFSPMHDKMCDYPVDATRSRRYCAYHRGFLDRAGEERDDAA